MKAMPHDWGTGRASLLRRLGRVALGPAPLRVFLAIDTLTRRHGRPPTEREVAREAGIHHTRVFQLVRQLREAGLLEPAPGKQANRCLVSKYRLEVLP